MQIRHGASKPPLPLDEIDLKIIDILRVNGRATNLEIATQLAIHPATVSTRLNRLDESKAMRVVAVSDFAAHGLNVLVAVGVKVLGRPVADVGRDLAAFSEVLSVNVVIGNYDLELLVALHDFTEISVFLIDHLGSVAGVHEIASGVAADIVKFEFNTAPL